MNPNHHTIWINDILFTYFEEETAATRVRLRMGSLFDARTFLLSSYWWLGCTMPVVAERWYSYLNVFASTFKWYVGFFFLELTFKLYVIHDDFLSSILLQETGLKLFYLTWFLLLQGPFSYFIMGERVRILKKQPLVHYVALSR